MLLTDIRVESPIARGALALFPLVASKPNTDEPTYLPGPVAAGQQLIDVAEHDAPTVPELVVTNRGTRPVLLVEGELLLGAKQDRTINVSVLVPAAAAIAIPVSCVEAGRWGAPRAHEQSVRHAPTDLRRRKTESVNRSMRTTASRGSDQEAVWDAVATYAAAHRADAPTSALEDVHASVAAPVDDLVGGLAPRPEQVGVVVAVGGEIRSLELFDSASTLAAYWDQLVRGYAMDALGAAPADAPIVDEVEKFLAAVATAPAVESDGVGLGRELHLDSDEVTGVALLDDTRRVVHAAAFAAG